MVAGKRDFVSSLCQLPATDGNFESALKSAGDGDIERAILEMQGRNGKDKGRILACQRELKRRKIGNGKE